VKKQDTSENQVNYTYLAIGSNLGKKIFNLVNAKYKLSKNGLQIIKSSSFYVTRSWPNPNFPNYINAVLFAKTNLSLPKLFRKIKLIEKSLGRVNAPKNYPRKCDIDIIDFNGKFINLQSIDLTVPHPRMQKRSFVLLPLFEINKCWIHPKNKKNIVNLISNLESGDIRSIKLV
tara:strand:+ start:254 stop:775 length:522 start_codon:yes stop_codon:yes gene_type:complete